MKRMFVFLNVHEPGASFLSVLAQDFFCWDNAGNVIAVNEFSVDNHDSRVAAASGKVRLLPASGSIDTSFFCLTSPDTSMLYSRHLQHYLVMLGYPGLCR